MTTPTTPPSGSASPTPPETHGPGGSSPRTRRIPPVATSAVLVAIFGGIAAYTVVRGLLPAPPAFATGDCVLVAGRERDAEVRKVDCAEPAAVYEVGLYLDEPAVPCPAESYSPYRGPGGGRPEFTLCLVLNATEGDCLSVSATSVAVLAERKVACASADAHLTVTGVLEGTADEAACGPGAAEHSRAYPRPERTVCLGRVPA